MNTNFVAQADWDRLGSTLVTAVQDTLIMVIVTMLVAGILGLFIGILLYTTRPSGILKNRVVYTILNVLVNFIRPIPFIILLRSEEHTSELQSRFELVCRLLLEKKNDRHGRRREERGEVGRHDVHQA